MTTEEIKQRIQHIRDSRWDDESAHSLEDALYGDFIKHIAESGCSNPELISEQAKLILTTSTIRFSRWCA